MCGAPASAHRVLGKRLSRPHGLRPSRKQGIAVTIMRCGECDLVFANPQPRPITIGDHYDVPPEEYWTAAYFDDQKDYYVHDINTERRLRAGTTARVLDIGAGLGKGVV